MKKLSLLLVGTALVSAAVIAQTEPKAAATTPKPASHAQHEKKATASKELKAEQKSEQKTEKKTEKVEEKKK